MLEFSLHTELIHLYISFPRALSDEALTLVDETRLAKIVKNSDKAWFNLFYVVHFKLHQLFDLLITI